MFLIAFLIVLHMCRIDYSSDELLGAISVSAPAGRISDDDLHGRLPEPVLSAANVIELNSNY